ncbi:MAG: hypothetical protein M1838_003672 [Thelocarpon superellum]|nr:MAG: hypothetical protein M1838_003672 [Thelocarpon superellum]
MASSSSAAASSLSRYKPAIIVLATLVTAYGVYVVWSSAPVASGGSASLHRSNAVHRRLRRPTIDPDEASMPAHHHHDVHLDRAGPWPDHPGLQPVAEPSMPSEWVDVNYGPVPFAINNRSLTIDLHLPTLPNLEQLQSIFSIAPPDAEEARDFLEQAYLDRFFDAEMQARPFLGFNDGWAGEIERMMSAQGFAESNIRRAMLRHDQQVATDMDHTNPAEARMIRQRLRELRDDHAISVPDTLSDTDSDISWRAEGGAGSAEGDRVMKLLFHIAEDQARQDGYVHRGISCSSCNVYPLRGTRYRCANCVDFDLCETCEALQVHIKTHVFFKIQIPTPSLANPKHSQPVWYPGRPSGLSKILPRPLSKTLEQDTGFEKAEIEALWEQFKVTSASEWAEDPHELGLAIDRKTFNRCLAPANTSRPPPPNLIYDRLFAFYDSNGDGLIGFEEYVHGVASVQNKDKEQRLKRIFQGYDSDGDGYVNRKDFLRMFRAYYVLSRERAKDLVASMEDDSMETVNVRDIIFGSQPISAAFAGIIPPGEDSRSEEGKQTDERGDLQVVDGGGVLNENESDTMDRLEIIKTAADRVAAIAVGPRRPSHTESMLIEMNGCDDGSDDDGHSQAPDLENRTWPPPWVTDADVKAVLGDTASDRTPELDEKKAIHDVAAKRTAEDLREEKKQEKQQWKEMRLERIKERWRRRQFYLDEEEEAISPGDIERSTSEVVGSANLNGRIGDASDKASPNPSHLPSPRSRSSSKVRFQDDVEDTDYDDVRSNPSTSSRSIPVGERWGGYEIPEAERDAGKEILYQVIQQGLNEMLDPLFSRREQLSLEVVETREERRLKRLSQATKENGPSAARSTSTPSSPSTETKATRSRRHSDALSRGETGGPSTSADKQRTTHLALLDAIEKQDGDRGGPGRIGYEEFKAAMEGRTVPILPRLDDDSEGAEEEGRVDDEGDARGQGGEEEQDGRGRREDGAEQTMHAGRSANGSVTGNRSGERNESGNGSGGGNRDGNAKTYAFLGAWIETMTF